MVSVKLKHCICGASLEDYKQFSSNFLVVSCSKCAGRAFVPSDSKAPAKFDYASENLKYGGGAKDNIVMRWSHRRLLELFRDSKAVVEIGCHTGFFLAELLSMGIEAFGIDVNTEALRHGAVRYGLDGRLASSAERLDGYNVEHPDLVFIDCLEHIEFPDTFLADHVEAFKPRRITIAGPLQSRAFVDRSDFPPHHLWRFTEKSIDLALESIGYFRCHTEYEYDLALLVRNMIGRLLYIRSRENWGGQKSYEGLRTGSVPFFPGTLAGPVSGGLLRMLGMYYASSILMYERCSDSKDVRS